MPNSNDKESFIKRLTEIINTNIANEQFGVNELAREVGMSRSNLHRRVKSFTGKSVSAFICDVRLDKASQLLKESSGTISEIAFECGFHSTTYFSKCFKDRFGFSPGEARNQMNEADSQEENSLQMESRRKPGKSISIYYFLATSLILLLTIALIVWRPFQKTEELADKSIAVLPFVNDNPDETEAYFMNGIMDELLINLQSIKELRVLGRTSTEQYRDNPKPIPEIASEMNVAFIMEASGQRYGNKIRLRVQLLEGATGQHIWADSYDEVINRVEDIFRIQSEIAQSIAIELQAVITPEEKRLIDKIPTRSLTAYEFYQQADAEHSKHFLKLNDMEALERAEELYLLALEKDSTFAKAYIGLTNVYWQKHYGDVLSEDYLDSMLILVNIALSYDDQLETAYIKRGDYYSFNNDKEQAIKEYDKALEINPNNWVVYLNSSNMYDDQVKRIEKLLKAASFNRGSWYLPRLFRFIAIQLNAYSKEKSHYYLEEALKLDNDSADHFRSLATIENNSGNFEKAIEFEKKYYAFDSTDNWVVYLQAVGHSYLGQYEESLEYFKKYEELNTLKKVYPWEVDIRDKFRIGYAYWKNGFEEEAESYIDEGLRFYNRMLELNRISPGDIRTLYGFAAAYAFRGDRDKAYEYLRPVSQKQMMPQWMVNDINNDPMFESIRAETEFQEITREIEVRYQAEHQRVRQWLEENEML
jgi:TolB-like protein/AraC-like DNA-binding protein/Tfp pilus assembly protein PilF